MGPFGGERDRIVEETTQHHYVLAHAALLETSLRDPYGFFGVISSERRDDFLADIWRMVRDHCDERGEPTFDISDVGVRTVLVGGFPTVVFSMPAPARTTEAYFVGITLKADPRAQNLPEKPEVQYLTLERGQDGDGNDITFLCGWEGYDVHRNYGVGPPADEEAFLHALASRL